LLLSSQGTLPKSPSSVGQDCSARSAVVAGRTNRRCFAARVSEAARQAFRPEFINRSDEVMIFGSLSHEHLEEIVDIQPRRLTPRLKERDIDVELTPAATQLLTDEGYAPSYGARPLKRAIQQKLLDSIALKLLQGEFAEGCAIEVDAKDGQFNFATVSR
jgi:ATP-dependent Clp protease ATP-binding subunit ClpA